MLPDSAVEAAQFTGSLLSSVGSISSRDGPVPSVVVGHGSRSEYATESTTAAVESFSVMVSPPLDRLPV